jgi:hypothetical protein
MDVALAHLGARRLVTMERGWVAGWGTLALINAGLAQSKGRSGPLATFLIVVLDPVKPKEA